MTESLQWHPVSERMPDADETVLLWYVDSAGIGYWGAGYFDGNQWRDSLDCGMPLLFEVTHWAQPKGPQ